MAFIGMNPRMVPEQIEAFHVYGTEVATRMERTLRGLMDTLSESWYSPKAIEFANYVNNEVAPNVSNIRIAYENIAAAAQNAYNAHAQRNGIPPMQTSYYVHTYGESGNTYGMLNAVSQDGSIGMDKLVVREAITSFEMGVTEVIKMIEDTPYDIALFDESGEQVAIYKGEIEKMKNVLFQSFNNLKSKLSEALEGEIQSVEQAASMAAAELHTVSASVSNKEGMQKPAEGNHTVTKLEATNAIRTNLAQNRSLSEDVNKAIFEGVKESINSLDNGKGLSR